MGWTSWWRGVIRRLGTWRSWTVLVLLPIFGWSCASDRQGRVWMDADFAAGRIALRGIELLPLRLGVNIDGVGRASWAELKVAHEKVAHLVDKELRRTLSKHGYNIVRGQMSRERLLHLLSQLDDATAMMDAGGEVKGVTPVLVAGGVPGTDAVLVVEGSANLTTGGKHAVQATVATLLVILVVAIIVFAIALAANAGKGGKGGGKGIKAGRGGRGSRGSRGPRRSGGRVTAQRHQYRQYRRYYRTHRSAFRTPRVGTPARYYKTRYRYAGRWVRYRSPYFRPYRAAAMVLYFSPILEIAADANAAAPSAAPPQNKEPLFSGSYLDLKLSLIEKGTGMLLWHDDRRWKLNAKDPVAVQAMMRRLFSKFPMARDPKKVAPNTAPPNTAPQEPPPPPPGPRFLDD
ncbi:MAG: hypothetical protein H6727_05640 [Myxococcales bacterium]|nr:hypothetical protein [Myxococcales bacterium]